MSWYGLLIYMVLIVIDAWLAGKYFQEKEYAIAFAFIAMGLFFLGVLVIRYSLFAII